MMRMTLLVADLLVNIVLLVVGVQEERKAANPAGAAAAAAPNARQQQNLQAGRLQEVASFDLLQLTGIAVSKTGRVFVNLPLWSDDYQYAVVEVLEDGSTRPFPDEPWNAWKPAAARELGGGQDAVQVAPQRAFVCVQSVWVDNRDRLWILDPASPRMEGVISGGPKLVSVNLSNNQVEKVIAFNDEIAPPKSYLNDVRVDTDRNYAYITDSGLGALVVVNLTTDEARRVLEDHPSTKAEDDVKIIVQGVELIDEQTGETPRIHADGIAMTHDGNQLYYHALTGKSLYRVPTEALRFDGESLSQSAVAERVEKVGETVVTDGLLCDERGSVYHTALERDAIVRFNNESKQLEMVVEDESIAWADSMAWGPDGKTLYFTTSQIHRMPRFNEGRSTRTEPYRIFRTMVR